MDKVIINAKNAPAPIGPYNQAVITSGKILFVSGQIPMDAQTGELVTTGIQDETHKVLENIKAILNEAGVTFNNVVKASVFVTDMGQFSQINEVYAQYFTENAPARELVQ